MHGNFSVPGFVLYPNQKTTFQEKLNNFLTLEDEKHAITVQGRQDMRKGVSLRNGLKWSLVE